MALFSGLKNTAPLRNLISGSTSLSVFSSGKHAFLGGHPAQTTGSCGELDTHTYVSPTANGELDFFSGGLVLQLDGSDGGGWLGLAGGDGGGTDALSLRVKGREQVHIPHTARVPADT